MREILFRAKKNYGDGEWIDGVPIQCYDGDWQMVTGRSKTMIDIETIGQYTGLTDKNGNKIFEGDIIKGKVHTYNGYRVRNGVITFHDGGYYIKVEDEYKNTPYSKDFKIIGNIHDNPELLADL